jgi:CO dehydrogenase nickel-insertion accessory protein CooC1
LLKVGVLGNGNVGKSFLLSRLFKIDIPSGYSVITEGLSLKFNEKENYTILDSAGLQTPLIKDEEIEELDNDKNEKEINIEEQKRKKYEKLYKDKTQTENFIQNLIIYLSDMLLVVVGKLTFNE